MYKEADIVILVDDGVEDHAQPTKENIVSVITAVL